MQVKTNNECDDGLWYSNSDTLVRIKSRYGTMHWPKDFYQYDQTTYILGAAINSETINGKSFAINKNIGVLCSKDKGTWESCTNFDLSKYNEKPSEMVYRINGVIFSEDTYNKINSIYNQLSRYKRDYRGRYIRISSNPFTSNFSAKVTSIEKELKTEIQRKKLIDYCSFNYDNLDGNIKIYKINPQIIFCSNNTKLYINIEDRLANYIEDSTYENCGITSLNIPDGIISTSEILKTEFEKDYKTTDMYPILYTDDVTFGYVPITGKVYLINNSNVVETTFDDMKTVVDSISNNKTYFYIKVFDKINSGPDEAENTNTIIKGLYNICE